MDEDLIRQQPRRLRVRQPTQVFLPVVGADNEETSAQKHSIGMARSFALCDLDQTVARLEKSSVRQHHIRRCFVEKARSDGSRAERLPGLDGSRPCN